MADIQKVADDDPSRCQHVMPTKGQCQNGSTEHSNYCLAHGGNKVRDLKNYKLQIWRDQVSDKANSTELKSLTEEIGIIRILIETMLNRCTDSHELMLASGPISSLILKLEKLVSSCHKMEQSLNKLVDASAVTMIGQQVIQIIIENIDDEDTVRNIAQQIEKISV